MNLADNIPTFPFILVRDIPELDQIELVFEFELGFDVLDVWVF